MNTPKTHDDLAYAIPDVKSRDLLIKMLNSIPGFAGILDNDRRLIHPNEALQTAISKEDIIEAIHLRPGDFLKCVNSSIGKTGCGSSEACELCGAFDSMKAARADMKTTTREFRLKSSGESGLPSVVFRFTTTPILINETFFYIFVLENISGEKRQAELEKIFFHDLLNSIGSLHGVISLLKKDEKSDPVYLKILEATYNSIYDTVNEQKQIYQAENRNLFLRISEVDCKDLMIENTLPFNENKVYKSKLEIREDSENAVIRTDPALLSRVVTNMIKNALEASDANDLVSLGSSVSDGRIRISVHNPAYIPREVQLQIFNRSYSTKGGGRGIGTYSMKLLGEEYLQGKVNFETSEKKGTTFWIDLPLNIS